MEHLVLPLANETDELILTSHLPDRGEQRLPLWLSSSEAEALLFLCAGGSGSPELERAVLARLGELIRAHWH